MHKLLLSVTLAALIAGCNSKTETKTVEEKTTDAPLAETTAEMATQAYDLEAQYKKFAPVKMDPDVSFLTNTERQVVNKLIEASKLMSQIYFRQLNPNNPKIRREIAQASGDDKTLLRMFNLHYGVCDGLEDGHVFYGDKPCPKGAGFYPADMTKDEFEDWITAHPKDEDAFRSGYTIIERRGERLVAIPYSVKFKPWLEPAAKLLKEASDLADNPSLKKFLSLRADAFLSDDYYESELAWMDLKDTPIEVAIGPYEVYDDGLFGYKTAFESFVTIKNPEESKALSKYKDYLRDMEANLPVDESYKNFKRGFESPIAVTYQVQGGGDNVPGVQTIAFNLPNDERVREDKGAKKVILNNVLGAKYDRILAPIGERVLVAEQAKLTAKKWMSNNTLFHELSHSLGPGTITVDGVETTVNAQLKDLSSGLEEGKADVMGAYNILYMMDRGDLPVADKEAYLATFFHWQIPLYAVWHRGSACEGRSVSSIIFFREAGAAEWLPDQKRYRLDFAKLEQAISDLTAKVVMIQGDGDYDAAKAFLDQYTPLDNAAQTVLGNLDDIPYDIRPIYPKEL